MIIDWVLGPLGLLRTHAPSTGHGPREVRGFMGFWLSV